VRPPALSEWFIHLAALRVESQALHLSYLPGQLLEILANVTAPLIVAVSGCSVVQKLLSTPLLVIPHCIEDRSRIALRALRGEGGGGGLTLLRDTRP
jgi:hypothetical protein